MQKIISSKFFIFSALFLLVLSFGLFEQKTNLFTTEVANAGAGDNVSGWAWANTPQSSGDPVTGIDQGVGWISFNSTNCDTNSNGFIDSGDCGGDDATTTVIDYGVTIDLNTGDFSGEAWSDNIGWISFNRVDTGDPFSGDIGSGAIAKLDVSGVVTGWARVVSGSDISGEWSGWISLNSINCDTNTNGFVDSGDCGGDDTTTAVTPYGVTLNASSEFVGYAWGDDVIGWVDFDPDNVSGGTGAVLNGSLNQAPLAPSVSGPATGLTDESITFTISASDPDGDDVRYFIDWDNNGSIDETIPSSGYVSNNTSLTANNTWTTDGTKTIRVRAEDDLLALSDWTTRTIDISIPQCNNSPIDDDGDGLIDSADPGCWIDPTLGYSIANYDPQDNNETDPQCYNSNVDDDGDLVADAGDPGCWATPGLPSSYDASDDDENNCGNSLCEVSANENFINCSADCSGKFEEF